MAKIDTLLFDLDGTLIDSNDLIIETFRLTLQTYLPKRVFSKEELIALVGPPLFETFQMISKDQFIIQNAIETYRQIYTDLEFKYIDIYPSVLFMLEYFKKKGFHIGIVTTKFRVSALPSLKHFKIDEWIDVLIGLDDVTHHKPHPESIYKALSCFNHQEAIMIGDSSSDILAGFNAGILTCGLDWSIKREELLALHPNFWIKNYIDLILLVEEYNKEET
ncbi:MAG: HAD-IA family hydrolase [Firmicutes bacterium]|nr:HAD-IA family hydrolase [Bacillota bacterium]